MAITRDDFEHWIVAIDDRLSSFVARLPTDISGKLDYSVKSLSVLEGWVLISYPSINDFLKAQEKTLLDQMSCYVGETIRKNAGGKWTIDLVNKTNAYFGMPVIEKKGRWVECPVTV